MTEGDKSALPRTVGHRMGGAYGFSLTYQTRGKFGVCGREPALGLRTREGQCFYGKQRAGEVRAGNRSVESFLQHRLLNSYSSEFASRTWVIRLQLVQLGSMKAGSCDPKQLSLPLPTGSGAVCLGQGYLAKAAGPVHPTGYRGWLSWLLHYQLVPEIRQFFSFVLLLL